MELLRIITPALIRYGLFSVGAILVRDGVITEAQFDEIVAGLSLIVVTLLWWGWARFKDRVKLNTALAMPQGSTRAEVDETIADGRGAANVPPTVAPKIGD